LFPLGTRLSFYPIQAAGTGWRRSAISLDCIILAWAGLFERQNARP